MGNTGGRRRRSATRWPAHINDYITGDAFGDPGSTYAGATAKALRSSPSSPAATRHRSAGSNLVSRLESLVGADGRIERPDPATSARSATSPTRSASPTPSEGLTTVGSPPRPRRYARSCSSSSAPPGSSGSTSPRLPTPSRPATANPRAPTPTSPRSPCWPCRTRRSQPDRRPALDKAVAWLKSTQAADGSFGGGAVTASANTNSTGLAAAALGESCADRRREQGRRRTSAASRCRPGQTGPLAAEVGAIAYDAAARCRRPGQRHHRRDQRPVAAARPSQATPALALGPAGDADASRSPGPTEFVKGGEPRTSPSPARPPASGSASPTRTATIALDRHRRAADRAGRHCRRRAGPVTVSATTGPGSATATVQVLGKDKLKPRLAKTVEPGRPASWSSVKGLGRQGEGQAPRRRQARRQGQGHRARASSSAGSWPRFKVGSPPAQGGRAVQEPHGRHDVPGRPLTMRRQLARLVAAVLATAAAGLGVVAGARRLRPRRPPARGRPG